MNSLSHPPHWGRAGRFGAAVRDRPSGCAGYFVRGVHRIYKQLKKGNQMENVTIKVGGMSCQGCVKNVTGALSALEGVAGVAVSLEAGEAKVDFDPAKVTPAVLKSAIEDAGFDAT